MPFPATPPGDLYGDLSRRGGHMTEAHVAKAVMLPFLSALAYMHAQAGRGGAGAWGGQRGGACPPQGPGWLLLLAPARPWPQARTPPLLRRACSTATSSRRM